MNARDRPPKEDAVPRSHRKPSWAICCRLADNVRKYRLLRGYTQHESARQCGFANSYVGDVEQATVNITLANLEVLAGALLHELFATAGDIKVSDTELQIALAPLSSPHRTRAAHALCEVLDQTATVFPGSRLRVRFAIRPPPCIGLAFPGSPNHRSPAS